MNPRDPQYKPKTTIIQANPGYTCNGHDVMAWVIEDGAVAGAVTIGGTQYGPIKSLEMTPHGIRGDVGYIAAPVRGSHE